MIEIIYHDGTNAIPCPPGQTGGFENAEGNGEVHCYPLLDGMSAMLMRLEMGSLHGAAHAEEDAGNKLLRGRAL